MLISEVSAGQQSRGEGISNNNGNVDAVVRAMEKQAADVEQILPMVCPDNTQKLRDHMMRLVPSSISQHQKLQLWKLGYRLWNACVDIFNSDPQQRQQQHHAELRHLVCDLLVIAGDVEGIQSCLLKTASFFYRTGVIWHNLRKYDAAALCFEKATQLITSSSAKFGDSREDARFVFDVHVARARTAWERSERTLTCTFLGRAKLLLLDDGGRYLELAQQYLWYGKTLLGKWEEGMCNRSDSMQFLNQAFDICSEALANDNDKKIRIKGNEERLLLESLKLKILRYLAAGHLQSENFESVLKCVAVLRDHHNNSSSPDHPSTSFLALKANIGLGFLEEAEKELHTLLDHGGAPVDVCISAVEIFLQSGGGALCTAYSAFFRLHGRFPRSKDLPLRVVDKILRNISASDQNYKAKVALALQIASDERIVSLLSDSTDDRSTNERRCLHAILWNSGSEFFRAKDYTTSVGLFEGSMLYLPFPEENSHRAKCLRVLCLCHLGLSQYDRADEYIKEAEKLEPNIICVFLKFKICLQSRDEAGATKQVERMVHCSDFEAEYLTLASHEAIACKSISVAIVALSNLLKLYDNKTSGKPISTKEAIVLRNIIYLEMEDPTAPSRVLEHFRFAKKRMLETGIDHVFGCGTNGEREIKWFAGSSWNNGLAAGKSNDFQLCAEFLDCASEFYGVLQEDSIENLRMQLKSLILCVAAMLASGKNDSDYTKEILVHLEKAVKVQAALTRKSQEESSLEIYCALLSFELRGRMREHALQLEILKHCISLNGCRPDFLLTMGLHACEGEYRNVEVASVALNSCLKMMMSSPCPDYKVVSLVIRKMIGIADAKGEEDEALGVYKQAHAILVGLQSAEYPTEEAKWLVSTAWNRSGIHVRFSRFCEAERWMRLGLDLVENVPCMQQHYKSSMTQCLEQLLRLREKDG